MLALTLSVAAACSSNTASTAAGPTVTSAARPRATPAVAADTRAAPTPILAGATPDRPFGPRTKESGCVVSDSRPDRACTPGAVFPDATAAQICQPGYSSDVRDVPTQLKREVYQAYGVVERSAGEYEVDHLVSLELGGSNDIANLWPEAAEPRPGFHEKDSVESHLHQEVCRGSVQLADAQRSIATDWLSVYQTLPASVRKP